MSDIIIGRNAVIEAFGAEMDIEKVFLLSNLRGEYEVQLRNLCKDSNIPLAKVPEQKLNELSRNKVHQGVVALISPIKYQEYGDVISQTVEQGKTPLIIVLDGITDVRNVGAIARSAYFFGADAIVIAGNFAGRISEDTVKASAGAILRIPICRVNSLFTLVSDLQSMGIKIVATSLQNAVLPHESDMNEPLAFVLGGEERGLHYKVLEIVDEVIKIPSNSDFDSLNVSVAAGIVLYECNKQRVR